MRQKLDGVVRRTSEIGVRKGGQRVTTRAPTFRTVELRSMLNRACEMSE